MANYYGTGRTNTFMVHDVEALRTALQRGDFEVVERASDRPGEVTIFAAGPDGDGNWSQWIYPDDGDAEPEELCVPALIAEHLQDGQVAVFVHAGSEKLRYVCGYSLAVHSDGRQLRIDIDDIYEKAAEEFGVTGIDVAAY
ncbi:hypothetical protein [Mycobacterium avium]|uniref:hypothetical protein n=1 Tax=Mycobacterium avium TaxID=1764 RepID=UPI000BB03B7F|nr:hypothetical protein [Mycobacterium avium]PBA68852.1 hypothetical protein CKJ76_26060 [Mycobacterium avium]